MRFAVIIIGIAIFAKNIAAQDLEKIGKKDMLKVNGGLNYSSVFYHADGIENRRQPFTYFVSGNISGNIAGISLPYTFNYSNNLLSYTQPYNINCFSPSYKWAKAYIGHTSMNFSPYTLGGHLFSGAGIELNPNKIKFSAMYGRLKKAVEYDFENNNDINMSYKRMGYGASLGYDWGGHAIKAIYFSARDVINSLSFVPLNTQITPMENTVISLGGKTTLSKNLTLEGEYALSGITRNLLSSPELNAYPQNKMPLLFSVNATSQFFAAYKGSLGYRLKLFSINFNYERVEPDYKTLGAYYFNNDFENYTIAPNLSLLQGKLNINVNTGLQKNNLKQDKLNTTKRWVGSASVNYAPNMKWNFNAGYSNFTSFTKQRPQEDPFFRNNLDTLNFYQIAQSANFTAMHQFGNNKSKQNIMLNANHMISSQAQGNFNTVPLMQSAQEIPAVVRNLNLSYNNMFIKSKLNFSALFNLNEVIAQNTQIIYWGPGINIGTSLFSTKMKLSGGSTYNASIANQQNSSALFSHRINLAYSPKISNNKIGKLNFSASVIYLQKQAGPSVKGFNEFTGNFSANYSF
ncbi:MAG: hypothetical protein IPM51_14835 [Sphingobacteriaceae bacterium]|nr:hypothetical protein [Sphingobacteriaceae bacterium]